MEEEQIQEFIHRVATDEAVRCELVRNAAGVIRSQGFSPRVASIISRLLPQLAFEQPILPDGNCWWHA